MRSVATMVLGASVFFGAVSAPCAAQAAQAVSEAALSEVSFTPRNDALEFVFRGRAPLLLEDVRVTSVGQDVFNIEIAGASVSRRWVQMPDASIHRALLHPLEGAQGAVLRVRMKDAVPEAVVAAAQVREVGETVVVTLPRSEAVAQSWAAADKAAADKAAADKAAADKAAADKAAADKAVAAPAPTSQAAVPVSAPTTVSEPPIGARPLALDEPEAEAEAEHTSANIATEGDSTSTGAAALTLCLLLGGGIFLWRKIKTHRPEASAGRMITPLSTHVLGPKHGLLLLDVAGEMVLLGTSETGVQMLTKIERSGTPTPKAPETVLERIARDDAAIAALTASATPAETAAPKLSRAERLGSALEKVKVLNARKSERLETADEDVTADALERAFFDRADEHLAEAADDVEDSYQPSVTSFFKRAVALRAAPEPEATAPEPTPTPAPKTAARRAPPPVPAKPEAPLANDILRKIRQLQGA
jgi:flagellar biogenesis protein FliO